MKRLPFITALCATATAGMAATTMVWTPAGQNYYWSNNLNWLPALVPSTLAWDDNAQITDGWGPTACIVNSVARYFTLEIAPNAGDEAQLYLTSGGDMENVDDTTYIGRRGYGALNQSGGLFKHARTLSLGDEVGSKGTYQISGGIHTCSDWPVWIGNAGEGEVNISGGEFITSNDRLSILGNLPGSHGVVNVNGGEFKANRIGHLRVGNEGVGEVNIFNGLVEFSGNFYIGYDNPFETSSVRLQGGSLEVGWEMYVGYNGKGAFIAETNATVRSLHIATNPGSQGYVEVGNNGVVKINWEDPKQVRLGQAGHGEMLLKGGRIVGDGGNSTFSIRDDAAAYGVLQGWGEIAEFRGSLSNNGLVIADGFGVERELTFTGLEDHHTSYDILHTIPNTSTNGWYARNGGKLTLARVRTAQSAIPVGYTWGDAAATNHLDLVNSMRVTFDSITGNSCKMTASLLAPDRTDFPPLPPTRTAVGIWHVRLSNSEAQAPIDFEARYDHVAAKNTPPVLYYYNPLTLEWVRLETTDLGNFRVKATGLPLFTENGQPEILIAAVRLPPANVFFMR